MVGYQYNCMLMLYINGNQGLLMYLHNYILRQAMYNELLVTVHETHERGLV